MFAKRRVNPCIPVCGFLFTLPKIGRRSFEARYIKICTEPCGLINYVYICNAEHESRQGLIHFVILLESRSKKIFNYKEQHLIMLLFLRFYLYGYKIFCRFVSETIKLYEMKQRTIIELLELVKENVIKDDTFSGMCVILVKLAYSEIITLDEETILDDYLQDNEPENVKHKAFWYAYGEKQPRIDWINEQIKQLKN